MQRLIPGAKSTLASPVYLNGMQLDQIWQQMMTCIEAHNVLDLLDPTFCPTSTATAHPTMLLQAALEMIGYPGANEGVAVSGEVERLANSAIEVVQKRCSEAQDRLHALLPPLSAN